MTSFVLSRALPQPRSAARSAIVVGSIAVHVAVGVGLFITGVWQLDRLTAERHQVEVGVMAPPAASSGAPEALPAQKIVPKRKVVTETVQPVEQKQPDPPDTTPTAAASPGTGEGDNDGDGDDPNGDKNGAKDGGTCLTPPCSETPPAKPPEPPKPTPAVAKPTLLPPTVLAGLRTSGTTQVHPPDVTKTEMLRDGKSKVAGTVMVCIGRDGGITQVALKASTKYPAYDQRLVEAARTWRYQPYAVNGQPMPACSVVTFVYTIK